MKLLLAIFQLCTTLHLDEKHGILFVENPPIRKYNQVEKLYVDILMRSPRELLNLGNLDFPDNNICYTDQNQKTTKTCEQYLDKFDEKILEIAKPYSVEKENSKREIGIQKREVVTAVAFGITIAITSIAGYFVGKAHTESDVDIIKMEMEKERERMANLTRAADITRTSLETLAENMRENGDFATTIQPNNVEIGLIEHSINFNGNTETDANGPWWLTKLVNWATEQFIKEHEILQKNQIPFNSGQTYKSTITAKCISAQKTNNKTARKFCEQFTEKVYYSNIIQYHGFSITKNENNKIKEIIFSSSINIPIMEEEIYGNYKVINLGTFENGIKKQLQLTQNIATNGLNAYSYDSHRCSSNGDFIVCPSNTMIPEDECIGNIFNENETNACKQQITETRKTCALWENDQFIFISMTEDVKVTKTRKIRKIEILPKNEKLQFKCPSSRRKITIMPTLREKIEITINKLNATTPIIKPENDIEARLAELHLIIQETNKTEEFHRNILNKTLHHFKEDVEKTAETIPEIIEQQLKEIFIMALPYLVTAAVIVTVTLLACCIIPCIYRKMRKTVFTNLVAYHPDDSPNMNPQSA